MDILEIKKAESNNYTSTIKIYKDLNLVQKIIDYEPYTKELFDREIFWLTKLSATDIVPKIRGYNIKTNTITMEWGGEVLCEENKPDNVYEQLYNIHIILLKNNCFYNDWKWGNFLVKDGKVKIIDFGWCPLISEDYSCAGVIDTELKEKPAGNYFYNIFSKE